MIARSLWILLGALACTLVFGCKEAPPPPEAPAANVPVAAPVGDAAVLLALDSYDPMYQVDANGKVIKLRLTGKKLTAPVLAEIGKLTEVRNLDFYGAFFAENDLAQLKTLQKVQSIGFGGTPLTDQGLAYLENLQSLRWLWVPNAVTEAAKDKLKEAHNGQINIYPG